MVIAYSGKFCEEDVDGCSEIECFDGVECIDVKAPGFGALCGGGHCPHGFTGDGQKCLGLHVRVLLIDAHACAKASTVVNSVQHTVSRQEVLPSNKNT